MDQNHEGHRYMTTSPEPLNKLNDRSTYLLKFFSLTHLPTNRQWIESTSTIAKCAGTAGRPCSCSWLNAFKPMGVMMIHIVMLTLSNTRYQQLSIITWRQPPGLIQAFDPSWRSHASKTFGDTCTFITVPVLYCTCGRGKYFTRVAIIAVFSVPTYLHVCTCLRQALIFFRATNL